VHRKWTRSAHRRVIGFLLLESHVPDGPRIMRRST
jgi:hypothetical protein